MIPAIIAAGAAIADSGVVEDIGDWLGGDGESSGALGIGQQKTGTHTVNQAAFDDPNAAARLADLNARRDAVDSRTAPTMTGTNIGPVSHATANIAQNQQAGPIERARAGELGNAAWSGPQTINRAEDQQTRGVQMDLLNSLRAQAAGKGVGQDLAAEAYRQANEQNMKNAMALAASRRGFGGGGKSLASVLDSTGADRQANAANLSQDKMRAALAAQDQLGAVASGVRGQDIGVNTDQAGLMDAAFARRDASGNQFALERFGAGNQMNLANAAAYNQNQQFNADLAGRIGMFNAGNVTDISKFNAGQTNEFALAQAELDYKTKATNLEAYLKSQGMDDEMARFYTDALMSKEESDRAARIAREELLMNNTFGAEKLKQNAYEGAANRKQGMVQGVLSAAGSVAGASSDSRVKTNVSSLQHDDDWMYGS